MTREKPLSPTGGRPPSVISQVRAFLMFNYPAAYTPGIISTETGLDHEGVKKAVQILLKKGLIERPIGTKRAFYRGLPSVTNASNFEDPIVTLHNMTWVITLDPKVILGTKSGGTPPGLYTQRERHEIGTLRRAVNDREGAASWFEVIDYWTNEGTPLKVIFQFYNKSVTIHLEASLKPVQEIQILPLMAWLQGMAQGYGVNVAAAQIEIVKAELSKDYERLTITPKMLEIRDLKSKSWLRIYRKMRNLTRLEIGTTYKGDLALMHLFKNFGKPSVYEPPQESGDDNKIMYG